MKENAIITGALIIISSFMGGSAFAAETPVETAQRARVKTYKSQVIAYSGTTIPSYTGGLFVGLTETEHKALINMTDSERKIFLESKGIVLPERIGGNHENIHTQTGDTIDSSGTTLPTRHTQRQEKLKKQKTERIIKKITMGDSLTRREQKFAKANNISLNNQ